MASYRFAIYMFVHEQGTAPPDAQRFLTGSIGTSARRRGGTTFVYSFYSIEIVKRLMNMGLTKDKEDTAMSETPELITQKEVEAEKPEKPSSPRKPKHRQSRHCCPTLLPKSAGSKAGGHKRTRRYDNTCFLLSLVDDADFGEVTIADFVESSQSVFEQLLSDRDSLEMWNDFMNRPGDEQEVYLQELAKKELPKTRQPTEDKEAGKDEETEEKNDNKTKDERIVHPAHTPEESFLRINSRLRAVLRRKRLPKGMLCNHEDDLIPWFTDDPTAVFISHINCSFDRLLLHAVCQYLNLHSISYDSDGQRETKVENSQDYFNPPPLLLSQYLETLKS